MKRLGILGSTGSIGTQTLDVVRKHKDKLKIELLSASKISDKLLKQIDEFKPRYVYIQSGEEIEGVKTFIGEDGLKEIVNLDIDLFINGIAGIAGIKPTYYLLEAGKNLATANKEAIICLGEISKDKYKNLFPIDSEHSAIFQCMLSGRKEDIDKIILTASGGPFLDLPLEKFHQITVEDALNHPKWKMGKKVSIDSATLMNKGLEVIEAHYLFDIPYEKIEVVIHPDSIIHGLIQFKDNSIIANISSPDMKIPISYAISYPERWENGSKKLDLTEVAFLRFIKPDYKKFPLLKLAYEVGKLGGAYPTVLTVADEFAVNLFLKGKIKFIDIHKLIKSVLEKVSFSSPRNLEEILEILKKTEILVKELIKNL